METVTFAGAARALTQVGRYFDTRGWVPATSGNFSIRLSEDRIAITASGRHKGALTEEDILSIGLSGAIDQQGPGLPAALRPSYETGLHISLYRRNADLGAVLHTHSVASTVLSRHGDKTIELQGYELLKIFEGIDTHEAVLRIPVYANDQDIDALAGCVDQDMEKNGMGPAYLIEGHGLYTWGADINTARYRVEALEFMLECELLQGQIRRQE